MAAPVEQLPAGGPSTRATPATFLHRLAAAVLDGLVLTVPAVVLTIVLEGAGYLVSWLGASVYFVVLEGRGTGQTLGKLALRIRVTDTDGTNPIGYGRAVVRYLGRFVSALPLFLGYLWMLWDEWNQTWHDKLARSLVLRAGPVALPAQGEPEAAPSVAATPAAWYPDPYGQARLRYWDGARWTGHTAD